ncbi:MAG: aminopeptidase [Paracoccaceae bacterium]
MSKPSMPPAETANLIVNELLAIQPGETAAIVTDPETPEEMTEALIHVLSDAGHEWSVLQQPARIAEQKNVLNPAIAKGLEAADIMIALTRTGGAPIYSSEVKTLLDAGTLRFMSMVMRDMVNFTTGGATADYAALYADGERLKAIWSEGRTMHITSEAGTDISAPIASDAVIIECGYATRPGSSAAFSDGEVSSRPLEGRANGTFVIDGPCAVIGLPETPIAIDVTNGKVSGIDGTGTQADRLRQIVDTVENADNIAEFGIGLNPACRMNGDFEEEKKLRGNVHIALGDNIFYGGTTQSVVHMDMVVRAPSVHLDERLLVDRGTVRLG